MRSCAATPLARSRASARRFQQTQTAIEQYETVFLATPAA
jgi:hypothetical protein